MFLLDWYREWIEIRNEQAAKLRELKYCESCETLKLQLSISNEDRERLLDVLIKKPDGDNAKPQIDISQFKPLPTQHLGWAAKRQMLEAEDRAKARAIRDNKELASVSNKPMSVEEIEKEIGVS